MYIFTVHAGWAFFMYLSTITFLSICYFVTCLIVLFAYSHSGGVSHSISGHSLQCTTGEWQHHSHPCSKCWWRGSMYV